MILTFTDKTTLEVADWSTPQQICVTSNNFTRLDTIIPMFLDESNLKGCLLTTNDGFTFDPFDIVAPNMAMNITEDRKNIQFYVISTLPEVASLKKEVRDLNDINAKLEQKDRELSEAIFTITEIPDSGNYVDIANKYRPIIENAVQSLSDNDALEVTSLYPYWSGNSVTYKAGMKVRYNLNQKLYKVLQDHVSQEAWTPIDAPSLFAKVIASEDPDKPLPWVQPDSTNPYMKGDRVTFNDKVYESLIDNNIWSPDAYPAGWKEII